MSVFDELKKLSHDDLLIQIDQFEKSQIEDEKEAFTKNGFDLNNLHDVFHAIYVKNQNSLISNQKFLELLQLILFNMEDENSTTTNALNRLVKEKKNSEREKNWNVLIETIREIMFKNKKLRNIFIDCSTQTDLKIEQVNIKKTTTIIREIEPESIKPVESVKVNNNNNSNVVVKPVEIVEKKDEEEFAIDTNQPLSSKIYFILSKSFGYIFQWLFLAIISLVQDTLTSYNNQIEKNHYQQHHHHQQHNYESVDSATQTNFLNHINLELKNKLKPVTNNNNNNNSSSTTTTNTTTTSTEVSYAHIKLKDKEIKSNQNQIMIPSNFKYSPPTAKLLLSPPPPPPPPPPPAKTISIEFTRRRSQSPSPPPPPPPLLTSRKTSIDSSSSKQQTPATTSPRTHMPLKDKEFAFSLANVKLRKVGESKNKTSSSSSPTSNETNDTDQDSPPIVSNKQVSFLMPPPPPPPPPPPMFPNSLLAQILNPNAHFARSTSVPPEPAETKEIELELNDHRKYYIT
jgi:hypothetical protein